MSLAVRGRVGESRGYLPGVGVTYQEVPVDADAYPTPKVWRLGGIR